MAKPDYYNGETILIGNYYYCIIKDIDNVKYNLYNKTPLFKFNYSSSKFCEKHIDMNENEILSEENLENCIIYISFKLIAADDSKITMCSLLPPLSKVWYNDNLVDVHGIDYVVRNNMTENYPSFHIAKGDNWFLVEMYKPQKPCAPVFQFSDYFKQCQIDFVNLSSRKNNITFNSVSFVCETFFLDNGSYSFMIWPNDDSINKVTCKVKDEFNRIFDSFNVDKGSMITIDCSKYDYASYDYFQVLNLEFSYESNQIYNCFFKSILKKKVSFWYSEMANIANTEHWNKRLDVKFLLQQYKDKENLENDVGAFWDMHRLYDIFYDTYHKAQYEMQEYYKKGCIEVLYYRSLLDDGIERIMFHLPYKYNKSKSLPLIINLSISRYSWESYTVNNIEFSKKFIFADVSLRGSTLGSYIGEANFIEVFNIIKAHYMIDENKVYLIGASNGAYGVWNIIEKYPDIFAAAIPLSGNTNKEFILNASNIPILDIHSDSDGAFFEGYDAMCNSLSKVNVNYQRINCKGLLHTHIISFLVSKKTIEWCLQFKRDIYPDNIRLTTVKDKNNSSYWIKIYGISQFAQKASVLAQIVGNNIIISAKDIVGLQINIPPKLSKVSGVISINGHDFIYDTCKSVYSYVFKDNDYYNENFDLEGKMYLKGSGILSVYYQPISIYVPQLNNKLLNEIAQRFAHPKTYAHRGIVSVDYPIYQYIPKDFKKSIIYLELLKGKEKYMNFNLNRFIKCDYKGFSYQNKWFYGEYVVMQVINDFNTNNNLLILSNSEPALKEHFFLRNLIIPGDLNGIHPYLNNCALIYFNKSYMKIYDWGMNIENMN